MLTGQRYFAFPLKHCKEPGAARRRAGRDHTAGCQPRSAGLHTQTGCHSARGTHENSRTVVSGNRHTAWNPQDSCTIVSGNRHFAWNPWGVFCMGNGDLNKLEIQTTASNQHSGAAVRSKVTSNSNARVHTDTHLVPTANHYPLASERGTQDVCRRAAACPGNFQSHTDEAALLAWVELWGQDAAEGRLPELNYDRCGDVLLPFDACFSVDQQMPHPDARGGEANQE